LKLLLVGWSPCGVFRLSRDADDDGRNGGTGLIVGGAIAGEVMRCNIFVGTLTLALAASAAEAAEYRIGALQIREPWARATPKGADIAAGYMTIINGGTQTDRLIGGSAAVAGRFELHQTTMNQGVMQMRPVAGGLEIKPGETIELKPGSLHAMLLDLRGPLAAGDRVKGTLVFQKAGKVDIEYQVRPIGGAADGHSGHGR
jgi:periplasmic copper chaperone A